MQNFSKPFVSKLTRAIVVNKIKMQAFQSIAICVLDMVFLFCLYIYICIFFLNICMYDVHSLIKKNVFLILP